MPRSLSRPPCVTELPPEPRTVSDNRRPRWVHRLAQEAGLFLAATMLGIAVILYCVVFLIAQHHLPGGFELTSTVNSTLPLVLAAVTQTLVVLTRGIDLSVGGVIDLTNGLAAITLDGSAWGHAGQPGTGSIGTMILGSLLVLVVGGICGLINGLLVTLGRLQPILVTLATLSIFQGIAIRVLPQPGGAVPQGYTNLLANPNMPTSVLWLVALAVMWWMFRRTRFGVGVYAIGNDSAGAAAIGVPVASVRILAYVLGGVCSGAAGLFLAATATAGDATAGNTYTLTSIVAAVLGGVSLFGGRGSGIGAIFGAFVSSMIVNILFFAHIDPLYQSFYEGVFLIAAVVLVGGIGHLLRRRY
jgi:ribose transport system permease protein